MGGIGLAHRQEFLRFSVRGVAPSLVAPLWLAILTQPANKNVDTGSTVKEIAYIGYQRAPVEAGAWAEPDPHGQITNAVPIVFPTPVAVAEGEAGTGWALLTAKTGGQLRWCGETPQLLFTADDPVILPAGLLVLASA